MTASPSIAAGFGHAVPEEGFPRAEHPVVRTHPVTGRKALFVNAQFHDPDQRAQQARKRRATGKCCAATAETPEFQCRFRWQPNSVAFWDNRCVQHHAMWDYYPQRRHGYRVTIEGDRPFYRA